jgi:hypothetical protein
MYIGWSIHERWRQGREQTRTREGSLVGKRCGVGRLIADGVGVLKNRELLLGDGKGDARDGLLQGLSLGTDSTGDSQNK